MNESASFLFSDKIIRQTTFVSMGIILLCLLYVLLNFQNLPPLIPLYNQMPWGEERLGTKIMIFSPILLTVGIVIWNILLSLFLYRKMPLVSRMLSITGCVITLITGYFLVRVVELIS